MDFGLTEQERAIRAAIQKLVKETIAPKAPEYDKSGEFPRENLELLGQNGFLGMTVEPRWGGAGASYLAQTLVVEAIAAADPATAVIFEVHNSLHTEAVARWGSESQKRRWLPDLISGKALGAFALTEAEAGSNPAALRTSAVSDGSGYRLNGRKLFITNGGAADCYLVFATVAPEAGPKGITAFLVPKESEGLGFGPPLDKLGIRASRTSEVMLDEVWVPLENRIGDEGKGYPIAMDLLDGGRIGIAAQALGIMSAALAQSLRYARERHQFGRPIGKFEGVQWLLADMATDLAAARSLTYEAARRRPLGASQRAFFAMAKLFASERAMKHASAAIQIHGGYGYLSEYGVEHLLRDAKITEIYEGTSEILRVLIATQFLKDYDGDNG